MTKIIKIEKERRLKKAQSFMRRAKNRYQDVLSSLASNYPEGVSASQEVIEFAAKSIFILAVGKYPKVHDFNKDENSKNLLKRTLTALKEILPDFPQYKFERIFFFSDFWSKFYEIAKYGDDEMLKIDAEDLFVSKEAQLAFGHAKESIEIAGYVIEYLIKKKGKAWIK